jgi:uncharacterized protein YndB with AHSA1/START domain
MEQVTRSSFARRYNSKVPDIHHDFPIRASADKVFAAIATPAGLDTWWTERSSGHPEVGAEYELWFGPKFEWRAIVSKCVVNSEFELELTRADPDWLGSRVGFSLAEKAGVTQVRFHHTGWPEANEHYRISCYCWAMYLRVMKRYVEVGEVVAFKDRLNV